jgi:hypothetical protein
MVLAGPVSISPRVSQVSQISKSITVTGIGITSIRNYPFIKIHCKMICIQSNVAKNKTTRHITDTVDFFRQQVHFQLPKVETHHYAALFRAGSKQWFEQDCLRNERRYEIF